MKIRTDRFHVPAECVAAHSVIERANSLWNSRKDNKLLFLLSREHWTHIAVTFEVRTCEENGENWKTTVVPADCMVRISHGGSDTVPGEWTIKEYKES